MEWRIDMFMWMASWLPFRVLAWWRERKAVLDRVGCTVALGGLGGGGRGVSVLL